MLAFLKDTFAAEKLILNNKRKQRFSRSRLFVATIASASLIASCVAFWLLLNFNSARTMTVVGVLGGTASCFSFLFSFLIYMISKKSELLMETSYEFALKTAAARHHYFSSFEENVSYIRNHMSRQDFPNHPVTLTFALSTLAYGLGDLESHLSEHGDQGQDHFPIDDFCAHLLEWIEHFEESPDSQEASSLTLVLWSPTAHKEVFGGEGSGPVPTWYNKKLKYLQEIVLMLERLDALEREQRLRISLYFSQKNDARVFLAKQGESYSGLITMFTPLTRASLEGNHWTLTGFSVNDGPAYRQLERFVTQLAAKPDTERLINQSHKLHNASALVSELFGISEDELRGTRGLVSNSSTRIST